MSCALPEISGGSAGAALPTPPQASTAPTSSRSARVVPGSRLRSDTAASNVSNNSRRRAGVAPLLPDHATVTSWPARSGQTADRNAGPNLSAHLARVSTSNGGSRKPPSTARSAAAASDRDFAANMPTTLQSLRGDADRDRVDTVMPHLVGAERPAQTARISTAAAAEGLRNKPPLVMQIEAYIRKELRLLGQSHLPHRQTGRLQTTLGNTTTTRRHHPQPHTAATTKRGAAGTVAGRHNAAAVTTTTTKRGLDGFEEDPFPTPGGAGGPAAATTAVAIAAGVTPPSTAASHHSTALVVSASAAAPTSSSSVAQRAPRLHSVMVMPSDEASKRGIATATQTGAPPRPEQPRDSLLPYSTNTDGTPAFGPSAPLNDDHDMSATHERGAALRPGSHERLVVFNEAYKVLVQHFSEYEDLFHTIKAEFDAAIREGDRHKQHTRELERELATAHGYVTYIVESETEKLRNELRAAEADKVALNKRIRRLESDLATAIETRNKTQISVEKLQEEVDDGHQRNKVLADALRSDAERQAGVVANLNKLRKENEHLQRYSRAIEDKARDDGLVIENLTDTLKDLGYGHLTPSGADAAGTPTTANAAEAGVPVVVAPPSTSETPTKKSALGVSRLQSAALAVSANATPKGGVGKLNIAAVTRALLDTSTSIPHDGGPDVTPAGSFAAPNGKYGPPRAGGGAGAANDAAIDQLEGELLKAREKAKKYQKLAIGLQKTALHQRKTIQSLTASRGERPTTPRPDWKILRRTIPDFNPSPENTSDELLRELQGHVDELRDKRRIKVEAEGLSRSIQDWLGDEDLCESDLGAFSKYFVGRGTGPDVPPYLRFHGRVRNKRLRKGDVERLLSQFWADREERRRADGDGVSRIQDFAVEWLTRTTGAPSSGIELAYNMIDVCQRNLHDPDCSLFVDVLFGRLSEEAYFESMKSLEHLKRVIRATDKRGIGTIPRTQMFRLIRKLYPGKSQEDMLKLRFALVAHSHEDGIVAYHDLFDEDTNGNQTRFVEYLRNQHVEEAQEFSVDLSEEIRASAMGGDEVSLAEARTALRKLDHAMPDAAMTRTLASGFATTAEGLATLEERTKVPVADFLSRVRSQVFLKRHSPKPSLLTHIDHGDENGDEGEDEQDEDGDTSPFASRRRGTRDGDADMSSLSADSDDDGHGGAAAIKDDPQSPASPLTQPIPALED